MPQQRWLITGCSSGFGEIFARHLLSRGDKVVATTRGDVSRLCSLRDAGADTVSLDVTAPASHIKAVVDKVLKAGPIDVIVNNAGYIEAGICEETSYNGYLSSFETNFFGVIKATQAMLPHFRDRKSGIVVFIGSSGGLGGEPGAGPYCATKFALEGWHECLKQETAQFGIKSIIFEPGVFRTKIMDGKNIKFRQEPIADYDRLRNIVKHYVQGLTGHQLGDPEKAVKLMVDVVKGEGVAEGKELPTRLPIGPDVLATMRRIAVGNLAICNDWDEVIRSTNHD